MLLRQSQYCVVSLLAIVYESSHKAEFLDSN